VGNNMNIVKPDKVSVVEAIKKLNNDFASL
jgi:hypothetical protein